jgi:hypothetical protein
VNPPFQGGDGVFGKDANEIVLSEGGRLLRDGCRLVGVVDFLLLSPILKMRTVRSAAVRFGRPSGSAARQVRPPSGSAAVRLGRRQVRPPSGSAALRFGRRQVRAPSCSAAPGWAASRFGRPSGWAAVRFGRKLKNRKLVNKLI